MPALHAEVPAPLHDPGQRVLLLRAADGASRAALERLNGP